MDWKHYLEETRLAWRKVLRPKVLITTTVLVLLVIALYFLFLLYKLVTADLSIMFWPNDVFTQENNFSISLRANNYLLCEATCTIALTKNEQILYSYDDVILRNNAFEAEFMLPETPRGEGRIVYTVQATCMSTGITACYARDEPARESAMIIHKYSLSEEERQLREHFIEEYPLFLETLRNIDEILIQAEQIQEILLLPANTLNEQREHFEDLLTTKNFLQQEALNWTFHRSPINESQRLLNQTNNTLTSFTQQLEQENIRRENINNLTVDKRIAYLLENSTLNSSWKLFLDNYKQGISSTLPIRYRALEEQARQVLQEQLLQQNVSVENLSFEEQWDLYCDPCTTRNITQTTLELFELPELIPSNLPLTYVLPQEQCNSCYGGRPILFLHGHSMNQRNDPEWQLGTFKQLVEELSGEQGFIDAGVMTPFSSRIVLDQGSWNDLRVLVRGTYYYDAYHAGGSYILSREPSESIDTYAIRVGELISTIQERTGAQEIDVVAHSMGGLVIRRYTQLFGDSNINQIITIGTPHYGTYGRVSRLCSIFGANKQCQEMRADSAMIARINDPVRQPRTPIISIVGYGCDTSGLDGDGIITRESATLINSTIYEFQGDCEEEVFHSSIVRDERVINLVRELVS